MRGSRSGSSAATRLAGRFLAMARSSGMERRYFSDPVLFARECLTWPAGDSLAPYQEEILRRVESDHRVCSRGPRGYGKSAGFAILVVWFAITRELARTPWKIVTTAGAWSQLEDYLWPEIRLWASRVRWDVLGLQPWREDRDLMKTGIQLRYGAAVAANPRVSARIEGGHAAQFLYVFDEAKLIPATTWDSAEGSAASSTGTRELRWLAQSSGGDADGRFYEISMGRVPGWWVRHVTRDETIAAGRMSPAWATRMRELWGETSPAYQNHVLGNFASSGGANTVIRLSDVERAFERWREMDRTGRMPPPGSPLVFGVDVGTGNLGRDPATVARRYGSAITVIDVHRFSERYPEMQLAGIVAGHLTAGGVAVVDAIGQGAGVVSRLREQHKPVVAFVAGAGSTAKDSSGSFGFVNCLTGDAVVAPIGDLLGIYRSRHQGALYRVKTARGDDFTATPNHKVLTGRGWVAVKSLDVGDKLCNPEVCYPSRMPAVGPKEYTVPATIGEIYGAAYRTFGAERVEGGAVDFHGDRPVGDVDIVRIDRELLRVRESNRQQTQDEKLIGSLVPAGLLSLECSFPHPIGIGNGPMRVGASFPYDGMPRGVDASLFQRHTITPQVVCFDGGAQVDPSFGQDASHGALVLADGLADGLDRLPRQVALDDSVFVGDNGTPQLGSGFLGTKGNSVLPENPPNHIPIRATGPLERVEGLTVRVPVQNDLGVDGVAGLEADSLGLPTDGDSVVCQTVLDGAPGNAERGAQRLPGFTGEVPLDEVVSIDVSEQGVSPFVYTLWTSTGLYSTTNVVHKNCRAEAWWRLREMLADPESEIALPPDPILLGELTAPGWKMTSNGRIQVESKDEIAKRLGKLESRKALDEGGSTNRADAVVQAFAIVQPQHSYEGGVNIGERAVYADDPEGDGWGDEMSEEY